MAKFFVIGEAGDDGVWLVNVEDRSVQRIEAEDLADAGFGDVALSRGFKGIDRVASAERRAGPSSHNRIEPGIDLAIAAERRAGPSSHNRIESGIDLAIAAERRAGPSSHNRIEATH